MPVPGEKIGEIVKDNSQATTETGNVSEYRFGNKLARIERIELVGKGKQSTRVFASNDRVTLRLYIRADREIRYPIYGFRIRNRLKEDLEN